MKNLLLTLATVSLITSSLGVAHAATEATLELSGTVEPVLAISFTPTAAASALDLASISAVKVADMNIESNSATGYNVSFSGIATQLNRLKSSSGDYIAYNLQVGEMGPFSSPVTVISGFGAGSSNLYQDDLGAAVNASFSVHFTSEGEMSQYANTPNTTDPYQLVAGTYTDTVTATIAANE